MMTQGSVVNNSSLNPKDKVLRLKWESNEEFAYRNNVLSMSQCVSKVMEIISLGSIKELDIDCFNELLTLFINPPVIYEKVNEYIVNMLNSYRQAIVLLKTPGEDLTMIFKAEKLIHLGNAWLTISNCLFQDIIEGKNLIEDDK